MRRVRSIYGVEKKMQANFANAIGGGYRYKNYNWNRGANTPSRYGNFNDAVETMNPSLRTQGIKVVNANTASAVSVTLFNSYQDPTDANLNADITITTRNAPNNVFLKGQIQSNPLVVLGCKFAVTTADQLANPWTIQLLDMSSLNNNYAINPEDYTSANTYQTLRVDMADVALTLDGRLGLILDVEASETVNFTFFAKGQVVLSNVANGRSVNVQTFQPPATGNFAFDFQQQAPGPIAPFQG